MNKNEIKINELAPGSVIQADSLLMRTRFGNWVSDGGFIVRDAEMAADIERGYHFTVIFDADEARS